MLAFAAAAFYLLFCLYLFFRGLRWTRACSAFFGSRYFQIPAGVVYWLLATTPLTSFWLADTRLGFPLKALGNYWLGTFLYLVLLLLLWDAACLLLSWTRLLPRERLRSRRFQALSGGILLFLIVSLSVYGSIEAGRLRQTDYQVNLAKDGGSCSGLTIALAADLHLGYNTSPRRVQKLVDRINAMEPDLVCLAGDIFDNDYDAIPEPERLAAMLAGIQSTYGVYACWGNHDLDEPILLGFTFDGEAQEGDARLRGFLDAAHIQLLEDETVRIADSFYLAGRKDPSRVRKTEGNSRLSPSQLVQGLDPEIPLLVLDHQPKELSELAEAGADLVLSGHTHDGQLWPFSLLVRTAWENPWGRLQKGNMTSLVTSGAGTWGPNMRVGTRSEVVKIRLTFSENPPETENPSL